LLREGPLVFCAAYWSVAANCRPRFGGVFLFWK